MQGNGSWSAEPNIAEDLMSIEPAVGGFLPPLLHSPTGVPANRQALSILLGHTFWFGFTRGWTAVPGMTPHCKVQPKRGPWGAPSWPDLWHLRHGLGRSGTTHYLLQHLPPPTSPMRRHRRTLSGHVALLQLNKCEMWVMSMAGKNRQVSLLLLQSQLCPSAGAKAAGSYPPPKFHMET